MMWTEENAQELHRKLAGKTIERVEFIAPGSINIVTRDYVEGFDKGFCSEMGIILDNQE